MTSGSARTALGAGARLALRPTTKRGSYISSGSGHQSDSGRESAPEGISPLASDLSGVAIRAHSNMGRDEHGNGNSRVEVLEGVDGVDGGGDGAHLGDTATIGASSGRWELPRLPHYSRQVKQDQRNLVQQQGTPAAASALPLPPPPPLPPSLPPSAAPPVSLRSTVQALRLPDMLKGRGKSRLGATAVLPENEAVEKVQDQARHTELGQILGSGRAGGYADLGWGGETGSAGANQPPPPAPGASGGPTRARWGSGHYYTVSALSGHPCL